MPSQPIAKRTIPIRSAARDRGSSDIVRQHPLRGCQLPFLLLAHWNRLGGEGQAQREVSLRIRTHDSLAVPGIRSFCLGSTGMAIMVEAIEREVLVAGFIFANPGSTVHLADRAHGSTSTRFGVEGPLGRPPTTNLNDHALRYSLRGAGEAAGMSSQGSEPAAVYQTTTTSWPRASRAGTVMTGHDDS